MKNELPRNMTHWASGEKVETRDPRKHPKAMTVEAARKWMNAPNGVVVMMKERPRGKK